jgi:outer membrane protein OmpA-like peptidoglycan-associated protein
MRYTILFFSTVFVGFFACSQWKSAMAEKHFRLEHYTDALDLYSAMLLSKKPTKEIVLWTDWNRKAGLSAWETHQVLRAIDAMDQLESLGLRNAEDFELQIAALTCNQRYMEAEKMAREAAVRYPTKDFFKDYSELKLQLNEVQKNQWSYLLTPASFNSGKGEMTSFLKGENLLYCSRLERTRTLNPLYPRDHGFYYHLRQKSVLDNDGGDVVLMNKIGHCGPLTENSKGTMRVLTRNFKPTEKRNPNIPLGLFFMHQINGEWTETSPFPHNSDRYNTGQGCFGVDDSVLVFTSNRPGGFGGSDLYYSIHRNGKWLEPVNLGENVNTSRDECFPFIQGNLLFFSSNGHCGFGGLDIYQTTFGARNTIVNLGNELNSSADDFGILGNQQMTTGFITSNRLGNIDRIYSFERKEPKIDLIISLDGELVNLDTVAYRAFLNNQPFNFGKDFHGKTGARMTLFSDEIATIRCSIEGFETLQSLEISTLGIRRDTVIQRSLHLTKSTKLVYIIGIDKSTNERIDSLSISLDERHIGSVPYVELVKNASSSSFYVTSSGFLDVDTVVQWRNGIHTDTLILEMTPIKKGTVLELEDIYYDFNKATLRPESKETLDRLYQLLAREDVKIELGSHTDSRGSAAYNYKLSEERANSCFNYLVEQGIDPKKIIPKGFGESQPRITCEFEDCTEEMHQINRRTEIRFLESPEK